MLNIKILGRGGQGVVSASYALASAFFKAGYSAQAFPMYGIERAGGPARAYIRVDTKEITRYDSMYEPNVFLIIDPTLVKEEYNNFVNSSGLVIINTTKKPEDFNLPADKACVVLTIDATGIGREAMGAPYGNTAVLGAFVSLAKLTKLELNHLFEGISDVWKEKGKIVVEGNQKSAKMAYDRMTEQVKGKQVKLII